MYGGVCAATVQVFLLAAAATPHRREADLLGHAAGGAGPQYCIEFVRGRIDTFTFKRLFEDLRGRLAAGVRGDAMLARLDLS